MKDDSSDDVCGEWDELVAAAKQWAEETYDYAYANYGWEDRRSKKLRNKGKIILKQDSYMAEYFVWLTAYEMDDYSDMYCTHMHAYPFMYDRVTDWNPEYTGGVYAMATAGDGTEVELTDSTRYEPDGDWDVAYALGNGVGVYFVISTDNAIQTALTAFALIALSSLNL